MQAQNYRCRVAAWIPNDARLGQRVGIQLGQTVDRLCERPRIWGREFVPFRERLSITEAESAAEIYDAHTRIGCKELRDQLQRCFMRGRQEDDMSTARRDSFD